MELNTLRLHANRLIRKEAGVSMMRSQISVESTHMEPRSAAEVAQLFGNEGQRGFDGIHLRGVSGTEKLVATMCRVIAAM